MANRSVGCRSLLIVISLGMLIHTNDNDGLTTHLRDHDDLV
jgi:hypothetical protein